MARVKRGGRELVIADSEVTEYLKSGYSVIDEHGNELTPAKAMTYSQVLSENGVLKKRVESLNKQLEAANREIADLKVALEQAETALAQAEKKAETTPDDNPPTEPPDKSSGSTLEQRQTVQANKSTPGSKPAKKGGKQA